MLKLRPLCEQQGVREPQVGMSNAPKHSFADLLTYTPRQQLRPLRNEEKGRLHFLFYLKPFQVCNSFRTWEHGISVGALLSQTMNFKAKRLASVSDSTLFSDLYRLWKSLELVSELRTTEHILKVPSQIIPSYQKHLQASAPPNFLCSSILG